MLRPKRRGRRRSREGRIIMGNPAADGERRIALAAVAGAHGVKGELRLKLFATASRACRATRLVRRRRRTPPRSAAIRARPRSPGSRASAIAPPPKRCAGRWSRSTATAAAARRGEYYHADLIGLPASTRGQPVGTVVAVENFGAGDLLEIELEGGKRSLIPFKPGIADLEDGRIVLDPEFLA
jgi:16S rRNA processing protein RimM